MIMCTNLFGKIRVLVLGPNIIIKTFKIFSLKIEINNKVYKVYRK